MSTKIAAWFIGIVIGVGFGVLLPSGIGVIVGIAIAIFIAKLFLKMSVIEVEYEEY